MDIEDLLFSVQESRLKILFTLQGKEPLSTNQIGQNINTSRQALHKNLKKMENRNIVNSQRKQLLRGIEEPKVYYSLTSRGKEVTSQLEKLDCVNEELNKEKQKGKDNKKQNMDVFESERQMLNKSIEKEKQVHDLVKNTLWENKHIINKSDETTKSCRLSIHFDRAGSGKWAKDSEIKVTFIIRAKVIKDDDESPGMQFQFREWKNDSLEEAFEQANNKIKELAEKHNLKPEKDHPSRLE